MKINQSCLVHALNRNPLEIIKNRRQVGRDIKKFSYLTLTAPNNLIFALFSDNGIGAEQQLNRTLKIQILITLNINIRSKTTSFHNPVLFPLKLNFKWLRYVVLRVKIQLRLFFPAKLTTRFLWFAMRGGRNSLPPDYCIGMAVGCLLGWAIWCRWGVQLIQVVQTDSEFYTALLTDGVYLELGEWYRDVDISHKTHSFF